MKKILFLLLLATSAAFGQAPTNSNSMPPGLTATTPTGIRMDSVQYAGYNTSLSQWFQLVTGKQYNRYIGARTQDSITKKLNRSDTIGNSGYVTRLRWNTTIPTAIQTVLNTKASTALVNGKADSARLYGTVLPTYAKKDSSAQNSDNLFYLANKQTARNNLVVPGLNTFNTFGSVQNFGVGTLVPYGQGYRWANAANTAAITLQLDNQVIGNRAVIFPSTADTLADRGWVRNLTKSYSEVTFTTSSSNPVTISSYQAIYASAYGQNPEFIIYEDRAGVLTRRTDVLPVQNYSAGLLDSIQFYLDPIFNGKIVIKN